MATLNTDLLEMLDHFAGHFTDWYKVQVDQRLWAIYNSIKLRLNIFEYINKYISDILLTSITDLKI